MPQHGTHSHLLKHVLNLQDVQHKCQTPAHTPTGTGSLAHKQTQASWHSFLNCTSAGGVAGALSIALTQPLDTVRVNLQNGSSGVQHQRNGLWREFRHLVQGGGAKAL